MGTRELKSQLAKSGAGVWDLCLSRAEGVGLFINALPLLEEETQGSGTICNTDFFPGCLCPTGEKKKSLPPNHVRLTLIWEKDPSGLLGVLLPLGI